ncbi:hypothetical protein ACFL5N_00090 [bacterium]
MRRYIILLLGLVLVIVFGCKDKEIEKFNKEVKGKWIFTTRAGEKLDLNILKEGRLIKIEDIDLISPRWSPDGRYIAVTGQGYIYIYTDEGELAKKIKIEIGKAIRIFLLELIWLDNDRIIYAIRRANDKEYDHCDFRIVAINKDTEQIEILYEWKDQHGGLSIDDLELSPNRKKMVFYMDKKIHVLDIPNRRLKKLELGGGATFLDNENILIDGNFRADGSQINDAFGQIRRYNLNTDKIEEIIEEETRVSGFVRLSPDKKYFYYLRSGVNGGTRIMMHKIGQRRVETEIPVTYSVEYARGKYTEDRMPDLWMPESRIEE